MARLLKNAGISGLLRSVVVGLVMLAVAGWGGGAVHLGAYLLACLIGLATGNWLAAEPESRYGWLKAMGMVLVVGATCLGLLRESMDLEEKALIAVVVCSTGLYLGAYIGFLSHPQVEIVSDS